MIRVLRLGTPRAKGEGLRIGTVRRPPRGVKKTDYARLDYYDVWLPDLAPSQKVIALAHQDWKRFTRAYEREMKAPAAQRLLGVLAALSRQTDLSVGCYCEDERRCHRSILRRLLERHGARTS